MSWSRRSKLLLCALCFGATLSLTGLAHAGEVKVGAQKLATDDSGNITDAGRKAATDELKNEPGDDEIWIAHIWAKLDKGAPGPLNIEFYGTLPDGKPYLTFRKVEDGYDGGKYFSVELELDGDDGFNKNKAYKIEITQLDDKGKEFKLASGKIKLGWVDHKEEGEGGKAEGGKEEGGKEESDTAEQDQLDTISAGGDGGGGADGGPPPVEGKKKKGCAIEPEDSGLLGLGVLFALGAFTRRRR
jgi:MYXO-CTERM domain-containing protein